MGERILDLQSMTKDLLSRFVWKKTGRLPFIFAMAIRNRVAQDAGLLTFAQYLVAGIGFLTTTATARLLGPEEYGIAAVSMAYPMFVWSFVGIKTVSVTTRYIASFRAKGSNEEIKALCKAGYLLDFSVSLLAFLVVVLSGWWIASHLLKRAEIFWTLIFYAGTFPFFSLSGTSRAILESWQEFRKIGFLEVISKGLSLICILGFIITSPKAESMVVGMGLGHILYGLMAASVATYVLHRDGIGVWWNASLKDITYLRRELFSFFSWNYLMVTLGGMITQVPLLLLSRLRSPQEAGFYRLASSVAAVSSYPQAALGRIAYPNLSARWGSGERTAIRESLKRWTLLGGLPSSALMLVAIPILPFALPLVFGEGYRPMIQGSQVLMLGGAVSALFFWVQSYYYASGQIATWTKAYIPLTAIIIGLGILAMEKWGFFGLAILVAVSNAIFSASMSLLAFGRLANKDVLNTSN